MIHDEGSARIAAQKLDLVGKAEATALPAGAAGTSMQGIFAEQNREHLT